MVMKKVLLMSEWPFPVVTGTQIRTWNFIKSLSNNCELSLFCFYYNPIKEADREFACRYFKNIWTFDSRGENLYDTDSLIARLSVFAQGIPWAISDSLKKDANIKIGEILKQNIFDVILIRYIIPAGYLINNWDKIKCRVILDIDDVETKKTLRKLTFFQLSFYESFRKPFDNRLFENYYKKCLRLFDTGIVCSEEDEIYITKKGWKGRIAIVPNAIDFVKIIFRKRLPPYNKIMFCGLLNYGPNENGIIWFVDKVLPLILAKKSDVELLIVGRTPSSKVENLGKHKNVHLYSDVPDMEPYYKQSALVIVPIHIAGGTRIKILEAAAYGCPVVATSTGAEGLGLENGKHCLIADDEEEFAQKCIGVLDNPELASQLADNNLQFLKERYDISIVEKIIRKVIL